MKDCKSRLRILYIVVKSSDLDLLFFDVLRFLNHNWLELKLLMIELSERLSTDRFPSIRGLRFSSISRR